MLEVTVPPPIVGGSDGPTSGAVVVVVELVLVVVVLDVELLLVEDVLVERVDVEDVLVDVELVLVDVVDSVVDVVDSVVEVVDSVVVVVDSVVVVVDSLVVVVVDSLVVVVDEDDEVEVVVGPTGHAAGTPDLQLKLAPVPPPVTLCLQIEKLVQKRKVSAPFVTVYTARTLPVGGAEMSIGVSPKLFADSFNNLPTRIWVVFTEPPVGAVAFLYFAIVGVRSCQPGPAGARNCPLTLS
jgi:hypothetical protein